MMVVAVDCVLRPRWLASQKHARTKVEYDPISLATTPTPTTDSKSMATNNACQIYDTQIGMNDRRCRRISFAMRPHHDNDVSAKRYDVCSCKQFGCCTNRKQWHCSMSMRPESFVRNYILVHSWRLVVWNRLFRCCRRRRRFHDLTTTSRSIDFCWRCTDRRHDSVNIIGLRLAVAVAAAAAVGLLLRRFRPPVAVMDATATAFRWLLHTSMCAEFQAHCMCARRNLLFGAKHTSTLQDHVGTSRITFWWCLPVAWPRNGWVGGLVDFYFALYKIRTCVLQCSGCACCLCPLLLSLFLFLFSMSCCCVGSLSSVA